MRFLVISSALHKYQKGRLYSYGPFVKEINLWVKNFESLIVLAPLSNDDLNLIDLPYNNLDFKFISTKDFNFISFKSTIRSLYLIPAIVLKLFIQIVKADHVHIRCPGNLGLLACLVQICFPFKKKTIKYAGNWDPSSLQPISYKLQKYIINSIVLSHNIKAIVYGTWEGSSKNIVPFFTASYSQNDIERSKPIREEKKISLIFVGSLVSGKRPDLAILILAEIIKTGYKAELNICGSGILLEYLVSLTASLSLEEHVFFYGNIRSNELITFYKKSHFLIFLSESEGWPKVVAEAMWWGCIPVSTKVSCVPEMLDYGRRGILVDCLKVTDISNSIINLYNSQRNFNKILLAAMNWAHLFTLEKFEKDIQQFL